MGVTRSTTQNGTSRLASHHPSPTSLSLSLSLSLILLLVSIMSFIGVAKSDSNNRRDNVPDSVPDSTRGIRSIVVVGGTHGNEYTGVWVTKALNRKLATAKQPLYKTFQLSTIIGNPVAHLANKRFIDTDLNRQFSHKAFEERTAIAVSNKEEYLSVEQLRAIELNRILGPKFHEENSGNEDSCSSDNGNSDSHDNDNDNHNHNHNCSGDNDSNPKAPKADLLIDLHTTTTNMGTTLITAQGDPLTTKAAAYVMWKCNTATNKVSVLMHTHDNQHARPHLSSIAPHCFSIEAGPVPQGVLRHDIVENTQSALDATLEFLERYNTEPEIVNAELQMAFPSGVLPCYVSAPSQRKGEISSKISWPSDPDNPNFPAWIVHKSVQDRDFSTIRKGDPLFVDLDGNVINYDGSHGSPITLIFINEGGYYYASSGTGISVAHLRHFRYETAELLSLET